MVYLGGAVLAGIMKVTKIAATCSRTLETSVFQKYFRPSELKLCIWVKSSLHVNAWVFFQPDQLGASHVTPCRTLLSFGLASKSTRRKGSDVLGNVDKCEYCIMAV